MIMKKFLLFVVTICCISCSKETVVESVSLEERGLNDKITVCHKNGNGQFQPLTIAQSAIASHLAHGDYLPDQDGDGHSAPGSCTGSMDDCDDTDPSLWDDCGGTSNCRSITAEYLESLGATGYHGDFAACHIYSWAGSGLAVFLANGYVVIGTDITLGDVHVLLQADYSTGYDCQSVVEYGMMSQSAWNKSLATLQAFIDNHPDLINLCGSGLQSATTNNLLNFVTNQKALLEKSGYKIPKKPNTEGSNNQ